MGLMSRLFGSEKDLYRLKLNQIVKKFAEKQKYDGCKFKVKRMNDALLIEMATTFNSARTSNVFHSKKELVANIKVSNNKASKVGVVMNSLLDNERGRELIDNWGVFVDGFVDELNGELAISIENSNNDNDLVNI